MADNTTNVRFLAAVFDREEDILRATAGARTAGFEIHDVYTPYPVHGMDWAMGLRRSRLTWIAFFAGVLGLAGGLALQIWTSAYSWPLNVGGKPFNSFPLFIPVAFELTVLFSGLIALGVLLVRNRLWIVHRREVFAGVTDKRFVLVLKQPDGSFNQTKALTLLRRHSALALQEGDRFV
jgi:hypothetical protein